jgi:hypothetical protein
MGQLLLRVRSRALTRIPQTAWVTAVTIFGFPVLLRLRHLIKQARIESIMKGN